MDGVTDFSLVKFNVYLAFFFFSFLFLLLEGVSSVSSKKRICQKPQNVKDIFIQESTDLTLQICM